MSIVRFLFPQHIKKMDVLLSLYIAAVLSAEILGAKTFSFFSLRASVAIFVFPLTFTINDIVAEVYGKARAMSFVKSAFVAIVFLFLFTLLALALPSTKMFESTNSAYVTIFSKSQRIIVASLLAFWCSEQLDVFIFSKIREKVGNSKLWLRNNLSNFISQFFDTAVFMLLAFYSGSNFLFVVSLIIPYWLMKCGCSVIETPLTYLGVRWLQQEHA